MTEVLITGIAGQTGSHLADYILQNHPNTTVHGIVRYRSDLSNLFHIKENDRLKLHDCELRDAHNINKVVAKVKPDKVFHLAATSFVRSSWDQPADVIMNNTVSQVNLFEALVAQIKKDGKVTRVHIAGSSEQYGKVLPEEVPITEKNDLRPISPYAVSKCAQEHLAYQYWQSYGLSTVITRTFNHCGPRRGDAFVESSFCKQVAMIEAGLQEPVIKHGNLESVRDYTDARDVAEAYWLAMDKCHFGKPYNICSNMRISIGELLDLLIGLSTFSGTIEKRVDPDRLRPSDVTLLYGDSTKFNQITGWAPKYSLEQTMGDLLTAWRQKVEIIKLIRAGS
jgi:GDP-4-dehydro-6-deoxy-D-mannose reductase